MYLIEQFCPWYFESCIKSHCKDSNKQVSAGQWHEEIVVDMPEFPVENHTDDNQTVVDDGKADDGNQSETLED